VLTRLGAVVEGTTSSDTEADEQARQMSISMTLSSFEWSERKINLLDTPASRASSPTRSGAARGRVRSLRDQRRDGRRVTTRRLWKVAAERDIARMLFSTCSTASAPTLPHAGLAQGRLRPARGRDGDPDRLRAGLQRRDRSRRHARLQLFRRRPRQRHEIEIPERSRRAPRNTARSCSTRSRRSQTS